MPTATTYPAVLALAGVANLALPLGALLVARRRLGFAWMVPLAGAAVFFGSQLLLRLPLVVGLQLALKDVFAASSAARWAWFVFLSFSAGLFEETGRWLGYRFLLRNSPRDVKTAVGFGLGHGGFEAVVLVGLGQLVNAAVMLAFAHGGADLRPAETREALSAQLSAAVALPVWMPLLSVWERVGSMAFHVGLSAVVLVGVARGTLGWLLVAVLVHGVANLTAVAWLQGFGMGPLGAVGAEVIVSLFAIAAVLFVVRVDRWLPRGA